jgi:hypothetical protein
MKNTKWMHSKLLKLHFKKAIEFQCDKNLWNQFDILLSESERFLPVVLLEALDSALSEDLDTYIQVMYNCFCEMHALVMRYYIEEQNLPTGCIIRICPAVNFEQLASEVGYIVHTEYNEE